MTLFGIPVEVMSALTPLMIGLVGTGQVCIVAWGIYVMRDAGRERSKQMELVMRDADRERSKQMELVMRDADRERSKQMELVMRIAAQERSEQMEPLLEGVREAARGIRELLDRDRRQG